MRTDPLTQTPPTALRSGSTLTSVVLGQTPPATATKRVSFGALKAKKPDAPDELAFPDPEGNAAILAARIAERDPQFDELKSALETDKAELGQVLVRPWFLRQFAGRSDVPSSVLVRHPGGAVRVSVKDAYAALDESQVRSVLGEAADRWFGQSFKLDIDGDKLGTHAQAFINDLQELAAKHGVAEDAITFKEQWKPLPGFKARRFAEMPLAQSLALETLGLKGLTQVAVSAKVKR